MNFEEKKHTQTHTNILKNLHPDKNLIEIESVSKKKEEN